MKIVIDIKGELKNDDLLIYQDGLLKPISKEELFAKNKSEHNELKKEIKNLQDEINVFKASVNSKLKDYHNVLQALTKEE